MATIFKNKIYKDIGTTKISLITTSDLAKATVIGLSLANLTNDVVRASVLVKDETDTEGYYIKNVLIPANQSLRVVNGGEKLILGSLNEVSIVCNTDNAVDALISYVEIIQ